MPRDGDADYNFHSCQRLMDKRWSLI